jgi:hypothetical protein
VVKVAKLRAPVAVVAVRSVLTLEAVTEGQVGTSLEGRPGEAPGAGGGGGGATGAGAVGGEGGGGGEINEATFLAEDLPESVTITVGSGGRGGVHRGDGEDGEDTAFGDLLQGKGGKGGTGGRASVVQEASTPSAQSRGLQVSSALLANYAEIRDDLLSMLGGAWAAYLVSGFPNILQGQLVLVLELSHVDADSTHVLSFSLFDAEDRVAFQAPVVVNVRSPELVRIAVAPAFQAAQSDVSHVGMRS